MCSELEIVLIDKISRSRQTLSLNIKQNEKIENVIKSVEEIIKVPNSEVEVIFCGKKLSRELSLQDLSIGPSTQLVAICSRNSSKAFEASKIEGRPSSSKESSTNISTFFVFCKNCEILNRGKLRVYCQNCSSTSILVNSEPQNWKDVLKSQQIKGNCENCNKKNIFAQFKFKCITCSEISPVLTHARNNWQLAECCICDEKEQIIFEFGCFHSICQPCFKQYLIHALSNFSFILKPSVGYTISCPFPGCNKFVQDAHHFYIMGKELYNEYQKKATERLVSLDDDGVVCPNPKCGQHFFWEPYDDDDGKPQCPDCFYSFCRKCNEKECICHNMDELTKTTIETTTKNCPKCNVATERNGGCAHIHCTFCGMDWCFKCVGPWLEECQWDHWF